MEDSFSRGHTVYQLVFWDRPVLLSEGVRQCIQEPLIYAIIIYLETNMHHGRH